MEHPDIPIDLLVNAVLDGRPVDWESAESSASSDDQRKQIRHFRTLAAIAALHRDGDAAPTELPAAKAETWGPLRLLNRIGRGSFGEVYRAWDTKLDREVALKLLRHRDSADSGDTVALEEGRLLARIRHPNVVIVFGADRIGDRVGIWMEFVHGRTLHQQLGAHGALSAREATAIGMDLCLALSAVHRAGLVHRDVKAQNIMREDGGRIVLMDFGTGLDMLGERSGELVGTPLYLAPEIFEGMPATARSDIYSLGVLLYHLVTGSYPVKGSTAAELRAAHAGRQRSWLRDERPDLPERFVQALERALEIDPAQRYESAGAMEASLARVGAGSDVASQRSGAGARPTDTHDAPVRRRTRALVWIAAGAAAAALVLIALVPSWRHRLLGGGGSGPNGHANGSGGVMSSEVVRKVALPGGAVDGTPSRDGRLFSVADQTGNLTVVDVSTGDVRRITTEAVRSDTGSQYAESSVISPDNAFIAYTWYALDGKYELRTVEMAGRTPRVLLRSDAVDYPVPLEWSRDGSQILATLARADLRVQLALVSARDGTVHPIRELAFAPYYASLSPDGQFVVYDAPQQRGSGARDIFIVRSDGSEDRRLVEHPANDGNPVWTLDGRVLFASDRSGTTDVWEVAVNGGVRSGEPQLAHRNIGRMRLRGITDAGNYFYQLTVGAVDVYQADLDHGVIRNAAVVPTSYSGSNLASTWSTDGNRLAYASRRGLAFTPGSTTLVIHDARTRDEREIVPAMTSFLPRGWLPDGRHILTTGVDVRGRWGNYRADLETGRFAPIVVSDRPSRDDTVGPGEVMPDGRILYYNAVKHALVARDAETGAEELVLDLRAEGIELRGGRYKVAPDGKTLALTAFVKDGEKSVSAVAIMVPGGPRRDLVLAVPPEDVLFQDWSPDGQTLLFTRAAAGNAPRSLWRVSIHGGEPQALGLSMAGLRDVSVNPGASTITFTAGWPGKELWVLEHLVAR